jgi:hypothetical protein
VRVRAARTRIRVGRHDPDLHFLFKQLVFAAFAAAPRCGLKAG